MKYLVKKTFNFSILGLLFVSALFIIGCSDSTSPDSGQGELKITMVDAPAGYESINIVVTRVEVHKADVDSSSGWVIINNNIATYDLLTLRNGASAILGSNFFDAGNYTQIRLFIGEGSNVVVDGVTYPLEIPSGSQSGLKLNHEFQIQSDVIYELLLDFDAQHSIVLTGNGQYKLKPVIRVIPMILSGTISGNISPIITFASVSAISGTDTVSTFAEIFDGSFKLMGLMHGIYNVKVSSGIAIYNDTTIVNVAVVAKQNTDLGTINLSLK
ncbi:MAG: DUF4382 domain-containing protein [Bacteroidetes bacterium]|nr:DUF4382 domain-containing protein [Bacteroidota bacterium]MBU1117154.1 DUF4382 domain-containing protein [Bacteroidota bacterium]MBU1798574.1 DUF4382 domain-containing protein [Bacteroidota bacterium]